MVNGHGGAATDAAEGKDQSDRIADAAVWSTPGRGEKGTRTPGPPTVETKGLGPHNEPL